RSPFRRYRSETARCQRSSLSERRARCFKCAISTGLCEGLEEFPRIAPGEQSDAGARSTTTCWKQRKQCQQHACLARVGSARQLTQAHSEFRQPASDRCELLVAACQGGLLAGNQTEVEAKYEHHQ